MARRLSDAEVCKNFLCGFCPNDLFVNTKADLGPCAKIHDNSLKPHSNKAEYEKEFILLLDRLVKDVNRTVLQSMQKLQSSDTPKNSSEETQAIAKKIEELLKKVETLGELGQVDDALQVMDQVKTLKEENQKLLALNSPQITVCDICGAFLAANDSNTRMMAHLQGKMHCGFTLIRQTLAEFKRDHPAKYQAYTS